MKSTNILQKCQEVAFVVFKYFLEFHVSKSNTKSTVLEASWVPPWEENLGKLCKYDMIYKIFLTFTVITSYNQRIQIWQNWQILYFVFAFWPMLRIVTKYQRGEAWITLFCFVLHDADIVCRNRTWYLLLTGLNSLVLRFWSPSSSKREYTT